MIPEWIKNAADEIRILTVGKQILAKWNAEWNELIATIIAKHAPVIGVDLSRDGKDYSMMVEGYHDKDGLHITDTQRVFTDKVRELVEAAREAKLQIEYLSEKFSETGTGNAVLARLECALEPFNE